MNAVFDRHMFKQADTSAVQIRIDDQMISRCEQLHHHGDGSHAAGKGQRVYTILQGCHDLFQMLSGRVL